MPIAKDIMVKKVLTIDENSPVAKLCDSLVKNKMSGLPVVDKQKKLVGFVSQRDIIASLSSSNISKKKAKDIMVKDVTVVNKNTQIEEISKIFSDNPIRCLPVLDDSDRVIGVILRKAVINRLLGYYY